MFVPPSEDVEKTVPLARHEGGSFRGDKNLRRSEGFPRDKERRNLIKFNHTKMPKLPYPNGIHGKEKDHPPVELNAYNRLLREGR